MPSSYLVDTDVAIDYLRGHADAERWWEALVDPPNLSVVTVAELYAGVRDGHERTSLDRFVSLTTVIPISTSVAQTAGLYVREYRRSHAVYVPDALIAATAQAHQLQLVSLNAKHFPMLQSLVVPYKKG